MINASARPQEGHSRVYNRNLCEVAVLFNEEPGKCDLILQLREVGIQEIAASSGHDGWHTELKHVIPSGTRSTFGGVFLNIKIFTAKGNKMRNKTRKNVSELMG